jgi:sulfur-carrier protein adenylyltransferase/sulfurtransferase
MVTEIGPGELARVLKSTPEKVLLLDVREPYERRMAVIQPSVHIPMEQIPARADELPRDRVVVVYCHSGSRSLMVAGFLESIGFPSVENLLGGIDAWSLEVDPTVPRYY